MHHYDVRVYVMGSKGLNYFNICRKNLPFNFISENIGEKGILGCQKLIKNNLFL